MRTGTSPEERREHELGALEREVDSLTRSVGRKDRQATMVTANQVTRIVADLTEPFSTSALVAITRLDYLGRELAIWSAAGDDDDRLRPSIRGLRREWDVVREEVEAKDRAVARRFEALVRRLETVGSRADIGRLAEQVLAEVDELERVALPQAK
jgi:hypothetical protein